MAVVVIHSPSLSVEAKKSIGDQVMTALHNEGIPASTVIVLFKVEQADLYLDGGVLIEARHAVPTVSPAVHTRSPIQPETAALNFLPQRSSEAEGFKTRARRTKQELGELKTRLITLLHEKGGLSSFDAQKELGLQDCDWAPATLRRFFSDLETEGLIKKEGQKRGTRYVLLGTLNKPTGHGIPILKKKAGD
jgi:hypothetical protein